MLALKTGLQASPRSSEIDHRRRSGSPAVQPHLPGGSSSCQRRRIYGPLRTRRFFWLRRERLTKNMTPPVPSRNQAPTCHDDAA